MRQSVKYFASSPATLTTDPGHGGTPRTQTGDMSRCHQGPADPTRVHHGLPIENDHNEGFPSLCRRPKAAHIFHGETMVYPCRVGGALVTPAPVPCLCPRGASVTCTCRPAVPQGGGGGGEIFTLCLTPSSQISRFAEKACLLGCKITQLVPTEFDE